MTYDLVTHDLRILTHVKILMCVCAYITGVGCSGGRTKLVTHPLYFTITSKWAGTSGDEVDAIWEQQWKWTQSGGTAVELNLTQSGSSSSSCMRWMKSGSSS